jgi:hypothetical protein
MSDYAIPYQPPILREQRDAARRFGRLIAQGILAEEDCLPHLIAACLKFGYVGDLCGLRLRLQWMLDDAVRDTERRWRTAQYEIVRDIKPLFEARAPSTEILEAAHAANQRAGAPLPHHAVVAIVNEEAVWWLRKHARARRYVR